MEDIKNYVVIDGVRFDYVEVQVEDSEFACWECELKSCRDKADYELCQMFQEHCDNANRDKAYAFVKHDN